MHLWSLLTVDVYFILIVTSGGQHSGGNIQHCVLSMVRLFLFLGSVFICDQPTDFCTIIICATDKCNRDICSYILMLIAITTVEYKPIVYKPTQLCMTRNVFLLLLTKAMTLIVENMTFQFNDSIS